MRRKEREVKEKSEIETIISRCDVCRIAFADNNMPYIVTMNFGFFSGEKSCFYFHCAPAGRKIEMIRKNSYVCFEMDTDHKLTNAEKDCDWGMKFSSVVGYGKITIVNDPEERKRGLDSIMSQYSGRKEFSYDERVMSGTAILRLDIEEITGKKIT